MEKSKTQDYNSLARKGTLNNRNQDQNAVEGLQARGSSSKKNITLTALRRQDTSDQEKTSFTMSVNESEHHMRQRLLEQKFKVHNNGGAAPDEMVFEHSPRHKGERDSDESDEGHEDPRQALYLDDKRYVVLTLVCLAGISNFVGFNVI